MVAVLGKTIEAPQVYAPEILEAIPRAIGRAQLDSRHLGTMHGFDVWHLYELSWLDSNAVPRSYVGVLTIPCQTPATVESKSLKLYLNSLNFHQFANEQMARDCIVDDVSRIAGGAVSLQLLQPEALGEITREPQGVVLDSLGVGAESLASRDEDERARLLQYDARISDVVEQTVLSHGLRSLCPVTGQPDWATLSVQYRGKGLDQSSLAAYVHSYRRHQEYHEQCVERIFIDLLTATRAEHLLVTAFYQRRGGIDITPWRSLQPCETSAERMGRQ